MGFKVPKRKEKDLIVTDFYIKQLQNLSVSNYKAAIVFSQPFITRNWHILILERGETFQKQDITQFWWKTSL